MKNVNIFINYLFGKAPLRYSFIVMYFIVLAMWNGIFFLFSPDIFFTHLNLPLFNKIMLIGAVPALMAGIFTLMIWLIRDADRFYRACDELEKKINGTKVKQELIDLHNNELVPLSKTAGHHAMYSRIHELQAVINAKVSMAS